MSTRAEETAYDPADAFRSGSRLLVLRAGQFASLFVSSIIVARALGPSGRAQYAVALTLASVIWVIGSISLDAAAGRILGRREGTLAEVSRLLSAATLTLGLGGAAVAFVAGVWLQDAMLEGASLTSIGLAAFSVPFLLMTQLASGLLFRVGALSAYGWTVFAMGLVQLVGLGVAVATSDLTAERALGISVAVSACTGLLLAWAVRRAAGRGSLLPRPPRRLVRPALSAGVQLHLSSVALYLNLKVDLLIVAAMVDARETGLYSLAVTLVDVLFVASTSMTFGATQAQTDAPPARAGRYTMDFVRQNLAFCFLLALAAAALAYPAIVLVYGRQWSGSVIPFAILAVAIVGRAIEGPARGLLIRIGRPLQISLVSALGLLANVLLNLALVPELGIAGSALASFVSYWLAGLLMLGLLVRETGIPARTALAWPRREDLVRRVPRRWVDGLSAHGRPGANS